MLVHTNHLIDTPLHFDYPCARPGRPGAAEPFKPRQDRKIATVRKRFWVPPISCPDISFRIHLLYNFPMLSSKWFKLVLFLAAGIGIGLLYGWMIDPVEFVDTTPETLRADYRADYVLMVAEAYHTQKDAGLAARRLAIFGSQPPAQIVNQALQTGRESGYAPNDLILLEELFSAMQAHQPESAPAEVAP